MTAASIAYGNVLNGLTQNISVTKWLEGESGNTSRKYSHIVVFFFVLGLRLNEDLIFINFFPLFYCLQFKQ